MFQENYLLQEEIKKLKEKIKELQDTVDRQKERLIGNDFEGKNMEEKGQKGGFISHNPTIVKMGFQAFFLF